MALLPPSVLSSAREIWRDVARTDHQFEQAFHGYEIVGQIPEADRLAALKVLETSMKPTPRELVAKELVRMRGLTKARAETAEDMQMIVAAFLDEIRDYPADVVVNACRRWARAEKWWPSWAELKDMLDFRMRRRRALLDALNLFT